MLSINRRFGIGTALCRYGMAIGALLFVLSLEAQTPISLDEVQEAGLWVVDITTVDGEEPEGRVIESSWQAGVYNMTYVNKVPCQIIIHQGNDTIYNSGQYEKNLSGATIRINGNTSAYYSNPLNMPYKIKLEKAADLLCRGDEETYHDKDWRLLKDATSLNTMVGLKLSTLIGMEWTAAYRLCNVVINGDFRGCYLLIETVKHNNRCRIGCDKQTGFIVERDPYWWKEDKYFSSYWYCDESMYRWTWKYPDEDDLTTDREEYAQQFIKDMEQSLDKGNYTDYMDVESWSRWLLAHDILGTRDSGGANMFFKKQDNTSDSRLEMPCLWDFDSNYDVEPGTFSRLHTSQNAYFSVLFNNDNKLFASTYVNLWNKIKDELVQQLTGYLHEYADSEEAIALDLSRKLYNRRWGYSYGSVNDDIERTLKWLQNHIDPLNSNIQLIDVSSPDMGIQSHPINSGSYQYYSLEGTKLGSINMPGIMIQKASNGQKTRKIIVR